MFWDFCRRHNEIIPESNEIKKAQKSKIILDDFNKFKSIALT